ncbi:MAG: hypothetical protein ACKJR1_06625, partial [Limisphaerales bacterium]
GRHGRSDGRHGRSDGRHGRNAEAFDAGWIHPALWYEHHFDGPTSGNAPRTNSRRIKACASPVQAEKLIQTKSFYETRLTGGFF